MREGNAEPESRKEDLENFAWREKTKKKEKSLRLKRETQYYYLLPRAFFKFEFWNQGRSDFEATSPPPHENVFPLVFFNWRQTHFRRTNEQPFPPNNYVMYFIAISHAFLVQ